MMKVSARSLILLSVLLVVLTPSLAEAASLTSDGYGRRNPRTPDYEWWYGCSPTAVGMMMGYYDRKGYAGEKYANLVPGGKAEQSTFGGGGARAKTMIASQGHIDDFYSGLSGEEGYLLWGDDQPSGRQFDSLADFMGTSQDANKRPNGVTGFWYKENGERANWGEIQDIPLPDGRNWRDTSGMYGIFEYLEYRGYGVNALYNQRPDVYFQRNDTGFEVEDEFKFNDFIAEIDAGRPVLIHVLGHTMTGYGYDAKANEILIHDTWTEGRHTMAWDGVYGDPDLNMYLRGVTVLEIAGGESGRGKGKGKGAKNVIDGESEWMMLDGFDGFAGDLFSGVHIIPEPGTLVMLAGGALILLAFRRRRRPV